ncbi:carboxymuconolactone decarboxylase family protein [Guptibacillus algicola]|uniref:carboxymuconolactone decarboxylase family protein n=1 Tax=Guptibacillus algicola TaxID=225844 RepID=UPI001CD436B5|nr:carboxymuconolactone decarboxylase family protein [Alkalihalobacillus algicola]MCA0988386.1 carboxymuconolactone decarboxylase family protein [Alkalihalobacillus algicola]
MKKAEKRLEAYRSGIETLNEVLPEAITQYNQFTGECFEEGEVAKATKHLMALSISMKDGDQESITYHMDQCVELGCSDKEIYETMLVSAAYGGGSAMSQGVTKGLEILKELRQR